MLAVSPNYGLIRFENTKKVLNSLLCGVYFISTEIKKNFTASDCEGIALEKLQLYAEKLISYDSDELILCWIDDFIKHCDHTIGLIQLSSNAEASILKETTRDIRLFRAMLNEMIT